jgi:hypothetical protein
VFQAVHHAVTTVQRTKIFSCVSDVEAHFYTLLRLLTAHVDRIFSPRCAIVIKLGVRRIHDFIPNLTTFVSIVTVTVGREHTSEVTYGAETTTAILFSTIMIDF